MNIGEGILEEDIKDSAVATTGTISVIQSLKTNDALATSTIF